MPFGEFLAEVGVRIIFEFLFYGITYWTGYVILQIVTFGNVTMSPFMTIGEKNRNKRFDWSFFLNTAEGRMLKMESVCLVGMTFWIHTGIAMFLFLTANERE